MDYRSIKNWPEEERPRERLLKAGSDHLSDAQLLAIILRTGGERKSALELSIELLGTFGTLKKLEQASVTELEQLSGIGKAKIAQVKAAFELGSRLLRESDLKGPVFSTGSDVYAYYYPMLRKRKKEVFHCALLDAKNRLIRDARVSEGTLTASLIHPREVFRDSIKESAAAVIFVHNHPSGDPTPSSEDTVITEKLSSAGDTIGIKVLDHIIIGDGSYTSMLEKGYLRNK